MTQSKVHFFVTGATGTSCPSPVNLTIEPHASPGYIGGSVLARFLKHPKRDTFEFTALVRSSAKAEKLKQFGVNSVIGSFSDIALIEQAASQADVVLSLVRIDSGLLVGVAFSENVSIVLGRCR
jgi:hypothetical protein